MLRLLRSWKHRVTTFLEGSVTMEAVLSSSQSLRSSPTSPNHLRPSSLRRSCDVWKSFDTSGRTPAILEQKIAASLSHSLTSAACVSSELCASAYELQLA